MYISLFIFLIVIIFIMCFIAGCERWRASFWEKEAIRYQKLYDKSVILNIKNNDKLEKLEKIHDILENKHIENKA